jgi:hypothetical protein
MDERQNPLHPIPRRAHHKPNPDPRLRRRHPQIGNNSNGWRKSPISFWTKYRLKKTIFIYG